MTPFPRALVCVLSLAGGFLRLPAAEPSAATPFDAGFSVAKMDRTVDPRVDFAKYASGGWYAATKIPDDKSRWGGFDELADNNWAKIRAIVEAAAANPGAPGSVTQKVGDFFRSAMDTATIERLGVTPIAADLAEIAAAKDVETLFVIAAREQIGIGGPFLGVALYPDRKRSDIYGFYLTQGGFSLPSKDYYTSPNFARERWEFVGHVAKLFELAGVARATAYREAETVFALEKALAENARTPVELRDALANYNKTTIAAAAQEYPGIPVRRFIAGLGVPDGVTEVIIGQPAFFTGLSQLLRDRPLDDWKIYLRWQVLSAAAPYLSAAFEAEQFRFFGTVLRGTPAMEPRWRRSAQRIDASIGEALGQLYVEKHYPPAAKARMDEMIRNLQAVFRDRLQSLEWMSELTRQKALAKFARFEPMIGFPDTWRDYAAVEIRPDDFLGNVVRAARADSRRQIDRIGQKVDRREWRMTPPTVNAYYSPVTNQIVFPAGILQPPFFDFTQDDAVNYGAIGGVIGHEMTHGFDDQGRRGDADGNLTDWWTPEDEAKFKERALTLVEQFNRYQALPGLAINGQLSLGENIGDLGGTSIAFEALQRSLQGKERPLIDGLTPEQRFFLSWAQQWRTAYRDDAMRLQVARGPHAPGNFRAIGPLVNQQAFFDAFGIKAGDPMWRKPEERAKIW